MILHIPHASTNTASLDIDPIAVLKTTDHFTDDLFNDGDISYHKTLTNRVIEQALLNLTRLHLFEYELTSLPKSLGNLTNLTRLNLSSNKLTSLPESS